MFDLDKAESYFLNHLQSLRKHSLPTGEPWPFFNAMQLTNSLISSFADRYSSSVDVFKELMDYEEAVAYLVWHSYLVGCQGFTFSNTCFNYKGVVVRLALSHKDRDHLKYKEKDGVIVLSLPAFLDDLEIAYTKIFQKAKQDPLMQAKMFVYFNETAPVIGHNLY